MKYIKYIVAITFLLLISAVAQGSQNDCEQLAKKYQNVHGGYLIFLNPINPDGSYELCRYCGHWLNLVYTPELGLYYYDSQSNTEIGTTKEDVYDWWMYNTGKKSQIWNVNIAEHPPFRLFRD